MTCKNSDAMIGFRGLFSDEIVAFDMYFASICSMQVHPGAGTKGHAALSVSESKELALDMLAERRKVLSVKFEEV